jgi:hypothetical protein
LEESSDLNLFKNGNILQNSLIIHGSEEKFAIKETTVAQFA